MGLLEWEFFSSSGTRGLRNVEREVSRGRGVLVRFLSFSFSSEGKGFLVDSEAGLDGLGIGGDFSFLFFFCWVLDVEREVYVLLLICDRWVLL